VPAKKDPAPAGTTRNPRTSKGGRPEALTLRQKIAARAMWEADPTMSKEAVAKHFGVSKGVIDRISAEDGWKKLEQGMTPEAAELADRASTQIILAGEEPTPEELEQASHKVTRDHGEEMRAQLLARHRKEWQIPRVLSAEAVKDRNFEKAKLAKITAETLKILQDGERKAWGLDNGEASTTVVIERN